MAIACATGVLAAVASGASAQALISTAPSCNGAFDPYSYTPGALADCGIATAPLSKTIALPGGGTRYDYTLPSGLVEEIATPPQGLNPVTASDAQLAEYMLPPRPQGLAQLENWIAQVQDLHVATPPPFLVQSTIRRSSPSYNYSGYEVDGSRNQFTVAEVNYNEPTAYSSACPTNSVATWAGLSSGAGQSVLGQDGTEHDTPGGSDYMWSEVLGPNGDLENTNYPVYVSANQNVIANVQWSPSSLTFTGYIYDASNGGYQPWTLPNVPSSYPTGAIAYAIIERPENSNESLTNLTNFKTMTINAAAYNSSYFPTNSTEDVMYDTGGTLMATPNNSISAPFGAFTDTQHSCK
ncbi:MAG: hypothetical protein ACLP0J_11760 [Solirubrobacteraceae bacterium]